jgi:type IV pilus assembly protein PilF
MKATMKNKSMRYLELFFSACVFCTWLTLGGCAGPAGASRVGAVHEDIVTESDETAERRRAHIRMQLALGYLEQGKATVALDEIKQAILIDPTYSDAFSMRGLIYMRLNDFPIAEDSFKTALSIKPRDSNVLHNMGWLKCQEGQFAQSMDYFAQALTNPLYAERAKTYMAQGLCQIKAGQLPEAEASLSKSYGYDAGNPVTGYNLANVLYQRQEFVRAQFYIRRLNNTELANAETLWLGIKIERRIGNPEAMDQLAVQLVKRFPQSPQAVSYQRGAFDE